MTNEELCSLVSDRAFRWEAQKGEMFTPLESTRLVAVSDEWFSNFYGRIVIPASCLVHKKTKGTYWAALIFYSIDDGDVPLIGPEETLEKATKRYKELLRLTETMSIIPSRKELEKLGQQTGLYLNL
jgi:hypothetical protein